MVQSLEDHLAWERSQWPLCLTFSGFVLLVMYDLFAGTWSGTWMLMCMSADVSECLDVGVDAGVWEMLV